jgi:uncharacterized protein (TIGR04141 family)
VYDADGSRPLAHWPVHYALVGSVVMNGARYALNEGLWYRIDDKYRQAADDEFDNLCGGPDKKLRPLKKIYPEGGKKSGRPFYQSERSYNEEIAAESDYLLLDGKLIPIENTPGRGIEACDLIDLGGHRLIHVKKSSRQSSVLSHFFKQGSNSAQLMRKYQSFAAGLIEIVRDHYGEAKATELDASLSAEQDKWTVEFQIADFPRENGQHNIPFFSKLSLRDEAHSIRAIGFHVKLGFITRLIGPIKCRAQKPDPACHAAKWYTWCCPSHKFRPVQKSSPFRVMPRSVGACTRSLSPYSMASSQACEAARRCSSRSSLFVISWAFYSVASEPGSA